MKRLVVTFCAIYVAAIALASATTGWALVEPVPHYRLAVFWMSGATLDMRVNALVDAGRIFEAQVYAGSHAVSWAVILTLALIGAIRPFVGPSRPLANMRTSAIIFGGLALLALLATWMQPILDQASRIPAPTNALSSMPGYWLAGMAVSAAITGGHLSLIVHDLALMVKRRLFGEDPLPEAA